MTAFIPTLFRDTACALAAALITILLGVTFVESTTAAPFTPTATATASAVQPHRWFGQPEPAVLVD